MEIIDTALGPVLLVPLMEFIATKAAEITHVRADGPLLTNLAGFCGELLIPDEACIIHENLRINLTQGRHIVNFGAVTTKLIIIPAVSCRIITIMTPFKTYLQQIGDQFVLVMAGQIYDYDTWSMGKSIPKLQFYGSYTTSKTQTGYYHGVIRAINATILRDDPEFQFYVYKCDESTILPTCSKYNSPQLYVVIDIVNIYQFRNWILKKYGIIFQGAPLTTIIASDKRTQQLEDLKMRQINIQLVLDQGIFAEFKPVQDTDIGAF